MKHKIKLILITLLLLSPLLVFAAMEDATQPITLTNPLGAGTTPQTFIGRIIAGALGIVGSLALLMFVYGGFTWMMSGGSAEKVKKGKDILIWAALGMAAIFMSYAFVRFVIEGIKG